VKKKVRTINMRKEKGSDRGNNNRTKKKKGDKKVKDKQAP